MFNTELHQSRKKKNQGPGSNFFWGMLWEPNIFFFCLTITMTWSYNNHLNCLLSLVTDPFDCLFLITILSRFVVNGPQSGSINICKSRFLTLFFQHAEAGLYLSIRKQTVVEPIVRLLSHYLNYGKYKNLLVIFFFWSWSIGVNLFLPVAHLKCPGNEANRASADIILTHNPN